VTNGESETLPLLHSVVKTGYHLGSMSCRKGKSKVKPKPGRYRCSDCGAVVKKKGDVCEPKKVKKSKGA